MDKKTLIWIYNVTKNSLILVFILSLLSGIIAGSFLLLALFSRTIIDIATKDIDGSIAYYGILIFVIIIMQGILNMVVNTLSVRAGMKMQITLRNRVFNSIISKDYLKISTMHSGEIMNYLTGDIEALVSGIITIFPQILSILIRLAGGLVILFSIDKTFTALILAAGIVLYLFSKIFSGKIKSLHKDCQATEGLTRAFMQENLENIVVVKSYPTNKPINNKLSKLQRNNFLKKMQLNFISNLANSGFYVFFTGGYYFALVWGALEIFNGSTLTFGTLTAFLQIIEQIKAPFRNATALVPKFYQMVASAERLISLEEIQGEKERVDIDRDEIYNQAEKIIFKNVDFAYDREKVLDNTSFEINKGEIVAIKGHSGIGKSTALKLLLALIKPQRGRVSIKTTNDEFDLTPSHRSLFAYVPQGNMIFSGTIRENVTLLNDSIRDESIYTALKSACIYDFVKDLPKGIDTVIGERGLGLSEGQNQRLSIARAIISEAPILLLDESTSALDIETERQLLKNIRNLKSRTVIFVSHKDSTLTQCDRIISF